MTTAAPQAYWWFDDVPIGHTETSPELPVDRDEMLDYARRNDPWPVHLDKASLLFRLNHNMHITQRLQPAFIAAVNWQVQMRAAVIAGDRLRLHQEIIDKRMASSGGRGVLTTRCAILNQHDAAAVITDVTSLVRTRTSIEEPVR